LVLTAVSTQGRSCISQVHSGPASLAPRPSPGASRTGSANAQGRGEQSSQGLTLLLVWSFAILRQQPQKCQLESKRLSKNLFQTLLVATSAFYLALFSRLQGWAERAQLRAAPRPELSLSSCRGSGGHPKAPFIPTPHPFLLASSRNELSASPAQQLAGSGFVPRTHFLAL